MNIESGLKHFSPKSMNISDTSRATATDGLTGTDVMGAFGMCQSKSPLGVSAVLAKAGISEEDRQRTIEYLLSYARKNTPRLIVKGSGKNLGKCLNALCTLAFSEYTRSAATTHKCPDCKGRGVLNGIANVMVHPGCGEKTPPQYRIDTTETICVTCHGKGTITARCRCNGTGRVRDIEKSKITGCVVEKECERCSGAGFRRNTGSKAYQVISRIVTDLHIRTWNRNWRPFFEDLVRELEAGETHANSIFKSVTRSSPFTE